MSKLQHLRLYELKMQKQEFQSLWNPVSHFLLSPLIHHTHCQVPVLPIFSPKWPFSLLKPRHENGIQEERISEVLTSLLSKANCWLSCIFLTNINLHKSILQRKDSTSTMFKPSPLSQGCQSSDQYSWDWNCIHYKYRFAMFVQPTDSVTKLQIL